MLYDVYLMIRCIFGQDAYMVFNWAEDLTSILCFVFAILMVMLTYKFWKFLIVGWWSK